MSRHQHSFTVSLIQMRCSTDPDDNLARAAGLCASPRIAAPRSPACLSSSAPSTSARLKRLRSSIWLSLFPGQPHPLCAPSPKTPEWRWSARYSNAAPPGFTTTRLSSSTPDGIARGYRKMHIPDDPLYFEKYYFTPGDLGFQAFDTAYARVGTLVCWDQWYPEAARLTALKGASILFYPTAIGWHPAEKAEFGAAQTSAWETIQRAHAIANGVYVAAVNRIGHEGPSTGGLEFWGRSFVADPFGRIIAQAGEQSEEVVIATCNPRLQEETRRNWPFLRDRRIDAYGPITERFHD